ncbi:RluA family pseudouridine synthase [Haliangium sp. UPWRP_2]|uniref:RluA family pseudouridine synthase n=1 Tax=Haliangium sp. UPWRP_2 TaxID=1931276 RepID=UPI000B53D886|nr:RluA family pseudouridine synthase [Haliangium sp. UPWRP_2]PSM31981.1 RluA family pseudouridine synthase [Haliangium sp. UPWRP_2]HNN95905.1 RluA family pseudouridine synthase [Pseudomonadota bacterium]
MAVADGPIPIVFENSQVVVVDKPAGWLSVPSHAGAADPRPVVGTRLQRQIGGRLWPVHRLDEDVSGLLVFARSASAHRCLCSGFERHLIEKTYQARCHGSAPTDSQLGQWVRWTTTLMRGKKRAYVHPAGKPAITDVLLFAIDASSLHFCLRPRTGRGHQLRVELARRGCPIFGDTLYGAPGDNDLMGIALRAVALDFSQLEDAIDLHLPPRLALPMTAVEGVAELVLSRTGGSWHHTSEAHPLTPPE